MQSEENVNKGEPAGTPPAQQSGDNGKPEAGEFLTKKQAEELAVRKLRGAGKQIDDLTKRVQEFEAAEEKRKAAEMSAEERAAKAIAEKMDIEAKLKAMLAQEASEIEEIEEENKKTISTLTKEQKELVPDIAPKQLAKWLSKFTHSIKTQTINVQGATGRGAAPQSESEKRAAHENALASKGNAFLFGNKNTEKKQ